MYKLATSKPTGHKGKRLTDENLKSFPKRLLAIWEKAGIIKKTETKTQSKKVSNGRK